VIDCDRGIVDVDIRMRHHGRGIGLLLDAGGLDPVPSSVFGVMLAAMEPSRLTLMTVHPVLPGTLKLHRSSALDSDRMDNLLKAHA